MATEQTNESRREAEREGQDLRAGLRAAMAKEPWFVARWFKTKAWLVWKELTSGLKAQVSAAAERLSLCEHQEAENARKLAVEICSQADLVAGLEHLEAQLTASEEGVQAGAKWIGTRVGDAAFWKRPARELEPDTVWLSEEIQGLRSQLFSSAIRLHKAFLGAAAKSVRHNLMAFFAVLDGRGLGDSERDRLIPDLWATLFLVTPVVSTTFASVASMLQRLPPESLLGWLLVDEAGQATPQAAVGAIMRCKKAVFVGDPLQIQPIMSLPKKLVNAVCAEFSVEGEVWSSPSPSAQTLADQAAAYGSQIEVGTGSMSLGVPLLVHRRCAEPMFGLSNRIAYGGNMVSATPARESSIVGILGDSRWIDISSTSRSKWSRQEGEKVLELLASLSAADAKNLDIFCISPFVIVAQSLRRLLRQSGVLAHWQPEPSLWVQERVGTVHTFQGKEAEAVILVLGAPSSDQAGARTWAGSPPTYSTLLRRVQRAPCMSLGRVNYGNNTEVSLISIDA